MNTDVQQVIVILLGIGCLVLIAARIYHTFNHRASYKSPCDTCAEGCELQRALKEKQRNCGKNDRKEKKSCCQ